MGNWLLFMLAAVEETATWTTGRILAIRALFEATGALPAGAAQKVYSKELVELIFAQPYVKVKFVVEAGIANRKTAAEYLRGLEQIGVLVGEKRGREVTIGTQPCCRCCPHNANASPTETCRANMSTFIRFLDTLLKHVQVMDISGASARRGDRGEFGGAGVLVAHAPEHGRERYTASDMSIHGIGDGGIKSSSSSIHRRRLW